MTFGRRPQGLSPLTMAGAGAEAGLDANYKARHGHIKPGDRRQSRPAPGHLGRGLPGVSSVMTHYMAHKMGQLDIPRSPSSTAAKPSAGRLASSKRRVSS